MIKVDFYLLNTENFNQSISILCRLVEKAYQKNHRLYINTDDKAIADEINNKLWTFRENNFIPHSLYHESDSNCPIAIGYQLTPENFDDVLINLTTDIPDYYDKFKRVIEFVYNDTKFKEHSRQRFQLYRKNGCVMNTHKV